MLVSTGGKMKPDYHKGDVVVGAPDRGIRVDCAFVAEYEPREANGLGHPTPGRWYYCWANALDYRKATVEDMDKAIAYTQRQIDRETESLNRLLRLKKSIEHGRDETL